MIINNKRKSYLFSLTLSDSLRLALFGTIIAVLNDITRLPLHLPGHSSLYWMGVLVLGKGLMPEFGAGIIMGMVSGILAVLLGLGKEGALVFFKYLVPGIVVDGLAPFFFYRLDLPVVGAILAALASLSKMLVNLALGLILKLPMVFLTIGLGVTAISHAIFGAAGGVIAAILIKRLRSRIIKTE